MNQSTASFEDGTNHQSPSLSSPKSPPDAKHAPGQNWAALGGEHKRKPRDDSDNDSASAHAQMVTKAQQEAYDILTGEADRQKLLRRRQHEDRRNDRKLVEKQKAARPSVDAPGRHEKTHRPSQGSSSVDEERRHRQRSKRVPRQGTPESKTEHGPSVSRVVKPVTANEELPGKSDSNSKKPPISLASSGSANFMPQFDAPVSAVNAGTRYVIVMHDRASTSVPITPISTPVDVLLAARDALAVEIDPNEYMLLEAYRELGLERPLRQYEHVRDVMNSWDRDDQNSLLLMPCDRENDYKLEVNQAPSKQPGDLSVSIYHSQKPGTWDKRWITLRWDGQVLIGKLNGTDMKNICHMSDFDIYIPTSRQVKKLKPPKKYCFAIKSQQKSAMFLSTANFVHFFATKDKQIATTWYDSVQRWRSWYLAHEMGLGQMKLPVASSTGINANKWPRKRESSKLPSSQQGVPFEPLPSSDHVDSNVTKPSSTLITDSAQKSTPKSFNSRGGPPVSFPKKLTKDISTGSPTTRSHGQRIIEGPSPSVGEEPFSPTGLLGRTYSERQKALQSEPSKPTEAPPQQLGRGGVKPLVDLTQHHPEPAQFSRKGHGVVLDHIPASGLVDAATSPDGAFATPQAAGWRPAAGPDRSATVRTKQAREAGQVEVPFTKGLLARTQGGQGGRARGRGVASGDRAATHPMLELEGGSAYAPGSLLSNVERWLESEAPVIDRDKTREVVTKTGEVD